MKLLFKKERNLIKKRPRIAIPFHSKYIDYSWSSFVGGYEQPDRPNMEGKLPCMCSIIYFWFVTYTTALPLRLTQPKELHGLIIGLSFTGCPHSFQQMELVNQLQPKQQGICRMTSASLAYGAMGELN